jgi:hypothetical protein
VWSLPSFDGIQDNQRFNSKRQPLAALRPGMVRTYLSLAQDTEKWGIRIQNLRVHYPPLHNFIHPRLGGGIGNFASLKLFLRDNYSIKLSSPIVEETGPSLPRLGVWKRVLPPPASPPDEGGRAAPLLDRR